MKIIKKIIKQILDRLLKIIYMILAKSKVGIYSISFLAAKAMDNVKKIKHNNILMLITVPNHLNNFRVESFATKEPETLEWIDSMHEKAIVWDIGANIGLYSIYAAKSKNCNVYAFEPSIFNLELLGRNIFINNLNDNIFIVPNALSDDMGLNTMRLTTLELGGALSSFGSLIGWDGNPIDDVFSFNTFGFSMDQAITNMKISQPDYIKMDVDGIEHIILAGGEIVLKNIKSILVEINDDFELQSKKAKIYLENAGLILDKKLHSEMIENSTSGFSNTYNQIWVKKNDEQPK
jgi:FkbM family methyltransferase